MKRFQIVLIFFIQLSTLTSAQTSEERGLQIAKKADMKDSGWKSASMRLVMTLQNKNGQKTTRSLHNEVLEVNDDGDKSIVVFDTPGDVKGTASLTYSHKTGPDDQWLYLPALNRVKRISSTNKSGPFMGSEFAYEDISSQEVEKYTYKYLKEDEVNQASCYLVERYPVDENSGYTRQQVWFNKENYRIEKIDFYDRKDQLLKTLAYLDYVLYEQSFWRASTMQMVNHQNGKQTLLVFSDYQFGIDLNEGDFDPAFLKNAR